MKKSTKTFKTNRIPAVVVGKVQWAKVHEPSVDFGTERYRMDLIIDDTNRDQIMELLEKAMQTNDTVDTSKPLRIKKDKEGNEILQLSKDAKYGPLTILDSEGNPLKDKIGNGSTAGVALMVGVANSLDRQAVVPSVKFSAIRVLDLVHFSGSTLITDQLMALKAEENEVIDHGF